MRVDTLWQRVLYSHAAIVGVMVFFATSSEPYLVTRGLVLFFYTLNTGITLAGFHETYSGLKAVSDDLKSFPRQAAISSLQTWVETQSYHRHALRRVFLLAVVWLVIGYLLLYPIIEPLVTP